MLLALSLAFLPLQSPDPGFLTRAATDYCEPYARREASMAETVARLQADGFKTYVDPDADTLFSFEQQAELTRNDGDFVRLYSNGDYRTCRVSRDDADLDKPGLDTAIQSSGRWLRVAPMMQDRRSSWVSVDGRMNLSAGPVENGLGQTVFDSGADGVLSALVTSSLHAPDVELARRTVTLAADQRSPAEAVIRGLDAICPIADQQRSTLSSPLARRLTREESLHLYEAEFARIGAPPLLRQRDPATHVALASPFPCTLAVRGAGRVQVETQLRLWLDQFATPSDEADVWNRADQTIFLETENLTLYVTVEASD